MKLISVYLHVLSHCAHEKLYYILVLDAHVGFTHDGLQPEKINPCSDPRHHIHSQTEWQLHSPASMRMTSAMNYIQLLRESYTNHQLFPPDLWPPALGSVYINLALVGHAKIANRSSLNEFEKATLHGTIDDLCCKKYSIELCHILKPDSFFKMKEKELKQENKVFEQQLIRMVNQSTPDILKKRFNIPLDDGKGLPNQEEVRDVLKQPKFLQSVNLRKLVMKHHDCELGETAHAAVGMNITSLQHEVSECSQSSKVMIQHKTSPSDSIPSDQHGMKILIDGAPGVGKTTLSWKISKDWAAGLLFKEFEVVIQISLREIPQNPRNICEVLPLGSEEQRREMEKELLESNGKKAIFILDGWDELSSTQRETQSLLYRLMLGKLLPQSTIIITSRPYTSRSLQLPGIVSRHIELCGFTQDQVKSCIHSEYSDSPQSAENLIQLLEARTDIFKLCYVPNNLSIVMHIFRTSDNKLPDTLTALYQDYIHSAKVRYVQSVCKDPDDALGIEDESQFPHAVKELYNSLCKVAYIGLLQDKFSFKESELKEFNPLLVIGANTLGLMTVYNSFTPRAIVKSFQFIHGTIQEFLAAQAMGMLPPDQQEDFILKHINSTRFRMVLLFYAGQTSLVRLENLFQAPISHKGALNIERFRLLVRMLYEAQNPNLCQIFAQSFSDRSLQLSCMFSSEFPAIGEFDILMLQYFLRHSSLPWKMLESFETPMEKLLTPLVSASTNQNVEEVHINTFTSDSVYKILSQPSFQVLKAIRITLKFPLSESAISFLASLNTLSHLHFDCFTQESLDSSVKAASDCKHLGYLGLKQVGKDPMKTDRNASLNLHLAIPLLRAYTFSFSCEGLNVTDQFVASISHELSTSQNFEKLSFKQCFIDEDQLYILFTSLQSNCTVKTLHISQLHSLQWNMTIINALEEMMSVNTSITDLKLKHCSLNSTVVAGITKALAMNQSLVTLDLSSNRNISNVGIIIQETFLSTIQILKLGECGLEAYLDLLANFVSNNSCNVKELDVSYNRINEQGGNTLFTALTNNRFLEILNMNGNPLWLKEGSTIEMMIEQNSVLKCLYLENSGLHVPAIAGVANGITKNSVLKALHLGVSLKQTPEEGACMIFKALRTNIGLERLSLSGYKLGDKGTQAAAEALRHNNTLKSLNFNRCKFETSKCLRSFIDALYSHQSLCEIAIPSTDKVLQYVFSEYDRINWQRAKNNLPYLHVSESGSPLSQSRVEKLLI